MSVPRISYLTIIADDVRAFEVALNLPLIRRSLSVVSRRYLSEEKAPFALEMQIELKQSLQLSELQQVLRAMPSGADAVIQEKAQRETAKRLAVFDMDSTLITAEVIDEIAKRAGVGEKVSLITERAMAGEIDFDASLSARVALLKGLPAEELLTVSKSLQLTPGAETLLRVLKRKGCTTALASGGFTCFAETIKSNGLLLDHIFANVLEIEGERLTGRVRLPIVNAQAKADALLALAVKSDIPKNAIMAVGDGANDIPMLQAAGLGIAFNAKPKTRQAVSVSLNQSTLMGILFLLGFADYEIVTLSR